MATSTNARAASEAPVTSRREEILDSAVGVLGRLGFKKASVDDLAQAAGLSKQGLYLHFTSKDELIEAAMRRYFSEGLRQVKEALEADDSLNERLVAALDAWFGRHLATFNPAILTLGESRGGRQQDELEELKGHVRKLLAKAIAEAPEPDRALRACTPAELARVLFQFGLTWKEGHASRAEFRANLELCVRACVGRSAPRRGGRQS